MGMHDESWCSSCGTSLPYSEEDVECGECVTEGILSFAKGRIAELTQLREQYQNEGDIELDDYTAGAIDAYDIIRIKLEG